MHSNPARHGLVADYTRSGQWLFRWRSFVPLIPVTYLLIATIRDPIVAGGEGWKPLWISLGLAMGATGLAVRAWAVGYVPSGTSGRATGAMKAETLNQKGVYSFVRHPLYLGNLLMWLGAAAFVGRPLPLLLTALFFWVYYERIMMAEEAFLSDRFGDRFAAWASETPALFPNGRNAWKTPDHPFSLRFCVGRDYQAFYGFVVTTFAIQAARHWSQASETDLSRSWWAYLGLGTTAYLVLHALKRRTHILEAPDR